MRLQAKIIIFIDTYLKIISGQVKKAIRLLKSEHFGFWATLCLVFMLLVFKGSGNGPQTIFGSLIQRSIEETSASMVDYGQLHNQLADISSITSSDTGNIGQGEEPVSTLDPSTVQENSLQALNPATTDYMDGFKSDQVIKHTVQPGDTIGSIASNFGVSINTVIWANNIKNPNALSIGEVLKIPPVSGVIHAVKNGDTVASIAKKYKADPDKILAFNNLKDNQGLEIGNELMIPGGELAGPVPSVKPALAKGTGSSGIYVRTRDGQCVSFVQAHGYAKLHGNAKDWAKYKNTPIPQVGGVVIFGAGRSYGRWGHIALITAVKEGSFQVVEQNFYGRGIIDHREVSLSDKAIVGFIR